MTLGYFRVLKPIVLNLTVCAKTKDTVTQTTQRTIFQTFAVLVLKQSVA